MSKNNTFEQKMTQLSTLMNAAAAEIVGNGGVTSLTPQVYVDKYRREINRLLIEITTGCEFKKKEKDGMWTTKFSAHGASNKELGEVAELLGSYITQYENPLFNSFVAAGMMDANGNILMQQAANNAAAAAGMSIPPQQGVQGVQQVTPGTGTMGNYRVTFIEKPSRKNMKDAIMGSGSFCGYLSLYIQVADLVIMSANADKMRRNNKRMMMIIGGVVLVAAAGVGIAIYVNHRRKKKDVDDAVDMAMECENMDVDCEDMGVSCETMDIDSDVPVVTL